MRLATALAATLLLPGSALAFCGHYAGKAGVDMTNGSSQVAVAHKGGRTTLTLANDFSGDATEFALVIPVPEAVTSNDVTVTDPAIFARLDDYSAPRLVNYGEGASEDEMGGCLFTPLALDGGDVTLPDTIAIESQFAAGEYDVTVLSAEESADLVGWLDTHGYGVSTEAEDMLQEYIDSGSYFLAAEVALDRVPSGRRWLSPLQISYDSDLLSLPIRLGTLSSEGSQDLVVYGLTELSEGELGISNYPRAEVQDECMVGQNGELALGFGSLYNARFQSAMDDHDKASWLVEYSWAPSKCDPCSVDPLTDAELRTLGFDGGDAHFTRLHLRFGPEGVDEDLMFYGTGSTPTSQIRYIEYAEDLDGSFSVCDTVLPTAGCAVAVGPAGGPAAWLALLLVACRRRRTEPTL